MFSIIPKTGTLMASDKNIETPFLASAKAPCGVLTTTPLLAKPAQLKMNISSSWKIDQHEI
jgi:hypothetical protein